MYFNFSLNRTNTAPPHPKKIPTGLLLACGALGMEALLPAVCSAVLSHPLLRWVLEVWSLQSVM